MLKYILILIFALPIAMAAQMTYVPDDKFEQALIDLGLDTGPLNDSVPTKNIDTVTVLDVRSKYISDLKGVEDFSALEKLLCSYNSLASLDVSKNSALVALDCEENKLSILDISMNPALIWIQCSINELTLLDVSKNPVLVSLKCYENQITNLDISKCYVLEELWCFGNQLSSLDISKNLSLNRLICQYNLLSFLDVSMNSDLETLSCSDNRLTSLELRNNSHLKGLSCSYNQLTSLDVSKNTALIELWCKYNPDLYCIQVADSSTAANNEYWQKDLTAHYSENCNYTGVEDDIIRNNYVSVSPNPASDFVEIDFGNNRTLKGAVESILIYNLYGEKVISSIATHPDPLSRGGSLRINISGLAAGVYFVRVGDKVQKFIKY
jgi:hypothetical protein